jgi:hypothetical protein
VRFEDLLESSPHYRVVVGDQDFHFQASAQDYVFVIMPRVRPHASCTTSMRNVPQILVERAGGTQRGMLRGAFVHCGARTKKNVT